MSENTPTPAENGIPEEPEILLGDEHLSEAEMRESFIKLGASNEALTARVADLTDTLKIVHAMQVRQTEMKEKQELVEAEVIAHKHESEERDRRTRRIFTFAGVALAVILPLVSILVYAALLNHVNDLLDQQKDGFYKTCLTRNQATNDNIRRESLLAKYETNPDIKAIHTDSAQQLTKSIIDCRIYLK